MQLILKLKNGEKEELTMEEAKELYRELHQIFGPKNLSPTDWPHIGERTAPWPHVKPFSPLDVYGPVTSIGVPRGKMVIGVDMAVKNTASSFTIDK